MLSFSTSASALLSSVAAACSPTHPVMEISLLCPRRCHTPCTDCASLICPQVSLALLISALPLSPVSVSMACSYPCETLTPLFIFFPMSSLPCLHVCYRGTSTLGRVLCIHGEPRSLDGCCSPCPHWSLCA